jgi:tetratricopeptide (TPR) repeat protein
VAVIGSALGLGGLHWAVLVICAALAVTAAVLVLEVVPAPRAVLAPPIFLLGLAAFTALQCVPLPAGLVALLSPSSADVWARALIPFGEAAPAWVTLSLDPGATVVEVVRWTTYASLLLSAIVAGARRGPTWGATTLFYSALVVGGITLLHGLLGLSSVYGLYRPMFPQGRWHIGPLLNSNNLAGYLNLGLLSGMGLTLSRRPSISRIGVGVGVAALAAMVAISGSRAGVVALLAGFGAIGLSIFRAKDSIQRVGKLGPALGAVAGAALLAWLGSSNESLHELFDRNIEKLQVFPFIAPLVRDHAVFGVGRGAFESVFPAYHVGAANLYFAHPENFAAQWIAEWGVPVGAVVTVALAWVLLRARREAEASLSAAGIWAGLVALVLQNLLDLGFEVPGVMAAAMLGLGALWGRAHRHDVIQASGGNAPSVPVNWRLRISGAAVLTGLAVGAFWFGRNGDTADRRRIHEALLRTDTKAPGSVASARRALRAATARHPADPYFPRIGAVLAFSTGDQNPVPWLGRALDRGMKIGQTHFELARVLAAAHARKQALLELKLAVTYQPNIGEEVVRLAMRLARTFDDLALTVPDEDAPGARMLELLAIYAGGRGDTDVRERCLRAALARAPESVSVRVALAYDRLAGIVARDAASACAGERRPLCLQEIEAQIAAIARLAPESPQAAILKARVLVVLGRARNAEELLRQECPKFSGDLFQSCVRARVEMAVASRSPELLGAASRDLTAIGCNSSAACADLMTFLGFQAANLGDFGGALTYYQRSVNEEPTANGWAGVAAAATALGEHALAASALKQQLRISPGDQRAVQRLNEETRQSIVDSVKQ